ncbi:phosphoglycerate mutase family [Paenibacillus sp. JCM 10914]|nr:phosphoglycerate mutase family [Paenibacillus sp. JCM 10914]
MNPPRSLQLRDPGLTPLGQRQSKKLQDKLPLSSDDLIVISPTRRTIETAQLWSEGAACKQIVHQAVGPRMFPLLAASMSYGCDSPLSLNVVKEAHRLDVITSRYSAWEEGINAISESLFEQTASEFLSWCKGLDRPRIYILTHDGTITAYRQYLGERNVTRQDFLGETGTYLMQIQS